MNMLKVRPMASREGWVCQPAPGGGAVGWPANSEPSISALHIDGPLLHFRNGELHWLTLWERLLFRMGWTDAKTLERKHRPHLAEWAENHCERCLTQKEWYGGMGAEALLCPRCTSATWRVRVGAVRCAART